MIDPYFLIISVIAGLAIWQAVRGLSISALAPGGFLHSACQVVLAGDLLFYWWRGSQTGATELSFPMDAQFIIAALILAFVVNLLDPRAASGDLTEHFMARRKVIFLSYLAFWLTVDAGQYIYGGEISPAVVPWAICLAGAFVANRKVQLVLPFLMGATLIFFSIMFL